MTGNSSSGYTYGGTTGRCSDETASGVLFHPPPPIHHGMVGPISTDRRECLNTRQKVAKIKL